MKLPFYKILLSLFLLVVTLFFEGNAQSFQTEFGKNKVQYKLLHWNFYRTTTFEVYFSDGGKSLAHYALTHCDSMLKQIEKQLDYSITNRITIIIFNSLSDFRQSNFMLDKEISNTGGFTPIVDNIAFVYFNGNHPDFEVTLRSALAKVVLNELIFGSSIQERIQNSALISLPAWYYEGLIHYLSIDKNLLQHEMIGEGIVTEKFKKFGRLSLNEQILMGSTLWKFIGDVYGKNSISNIVYLTHVNKSIESGFDFVLGKTFIQIYNQWYSFYRYEILSVEDENYTSLENATDLSFLSKNEIPQRIKFSPDGSRIAIVTNNEGKQKIKIWEPETGKVKTIFRKGFKNIETKPDENYPLLDWHPRKPILTIIYEKKGDPVIINYNFEKTKLEDKTGLDKVNRITSFSYNSSGSYMAMSAIKNGYSDIFIYEPRSFRLNQVTNDIYDDLSPVFFKNNEYIAFSSNRNNPDISLKIYNPETDLDNGFDIYIFDLKDKDNILHQVTFTKGIDEFNPKTIDSSFLSYLTNQNGLINRDAVYPDSVFEYSAIIVHYKDSLKFKTDTFIFNTPELSTLAPGSFILKDSNTLQFDSVVVYKDTSYVFPLTNYRYDIHSYDVNRHTMSIAELFRIEGIYKIWLTQIPELIPQSFVNRVKFTHPEENYYKKRQPDVSTDFIDNNTKLPEIVPPPTNDLAKNYDYYFINDFEIIAQADSIEQNRKFKFEGLQYLPIRKDTILKPTFRRTKFGSSSSYFLSFVPDYMVSQLDNNNLQSPYLPYSKDASLIPINRVTNAMIMMGINDLMRDYRYTGGFRLKGNLSGIDYLFSFENLKRRIDKKFTFYRKTETNDNLYTRSKQFVNEGRFQLKYPFSEYASFRTEVFGRQDKFITLSSEKTSLMTPDVSSVYLGYKVEYVFDNTRKIALNLMTGTRFKIYLEKFNNFNNKNDQLNVAGGDFRCYTRILKQSIWANRLAFASSGGSSKVVFILGGVDSWLFPRIEQNIQIDPEKNYVYQSLAVNMRGFTQNIRNGNSYAIFNTELRIPVMKYFYKNPFKSAFFENLQFIAFGDLGTAWTGSNPYSSNNSLNKRIIDNYPFLIKVNSIGKPMVEGYGIGVRTMVLGYFIKLDRAWGVEGGFFYKNITYLSFGLDF